MRRLQRPRVPPDRRAAAGRAGFDTEGHGHRRGHRARHRERPRLVRKAGGDPKKLRKIKKKQPPEGFVGWNKQTFERLIGAAPETLQAAPEDHALHGARRGRCRAATPAARVHELVADSAQTRRGEGGAVRARRRDLRRRCIDAGVVERARGRRTARADVRPPPSTCRTTSRSTSRSRRFCWPRSSFSTRRVETYALDVISMVEATLEDPRQVLRAQEQRGPRPARMAEMKADGVDYDERMERLARGHVPQAARGAARAPPSREYCEKVPWARDFELIPEVGRCATWWRRPRDFKELRAAATASRARRARFCATSPTRTACSTAPCRSDKRDERLRATSSRGSASWCARWTRRLVDEWARPASVPRRARRRSAAPRTRWCATGAASRCSCATPSSPACGSPRRDGGRAWASSTPSGASARGRVAAGARRASTRRTRTCCIDADARSTAYFSIDETRRAGRPTSGTCTRSFRDSDDDRDFGIWRDVDLDATQDEGAVAFSSYRAGFVDD